MRSRCTRSVPLVEGGAKIRRIISDDNEANSKEIPAQVCIGCKRDDLSIGEVRTTLRIDSISIYFLWKDFVPSFSHFIILDNSDAEGI